MRTQILILPGDSAEASPNKSKNRMRYHRLKKEWEQTAITAWDNEWTEPLAGKVQVSYVSYRKRLMDHGNLSDSLVFKACEDGLIGRAYKNDDPRYVERGPVRQEITQGKPFLVMILQEVEDGV